MDITSTPNLKPFRDYDPHEVLNVYAHNLSEVNKGTFVTVTAAEGNTNVSQNANSPATPHVGDAGDLSVNSPSRATIKRQAVSWKIDTAVSGDTVLGVMLYDVKEENAWGEKFIFKPRHERHEQQIVVSGEAVPVLTRGVVKINGFVGTPGPNSGAVVSTGNNSGLLHVSAYGTAGTVGKFVTSADADGYAIFKVEL